MKRKWIWFFIAALIIAIPVAIIKAQVYASERLLQEQVDLAREEGISVSGKDFAATIPAVLPEVNAAPLYLN